jgi:hypothetical protein
MNSGEFVAPSPRIADYVEGLLTRWLDIDADAGLNSPWSASSLLGNAS